MLIENEEIRRGQVKDPSSPRSKIISIEELLKIISQSTSNWLGNNFKKFFDRNYFRSRILPTSHA